MVEIETASETLPSGAVRFVHINQAYEITVAAAAAFVKPGSQFHQPHQVAVTHASAFRGVERVGEPVFVHTFPNGLGCRTAAGQCSEHVQPSQKRGCQFRVFPKGRIFVVNKVFGEIPQSVI